MEKVWCTGFHTSKLHCMWQHNACVYALSIQAWTHRASARNHSLYIHIFYIISSFLHLLMLPPSLLYIIIITIFVIHSIVHRATRSHNRCGVGNIYMSITINILFIIVYESEEKSWARERKRESEKQKKLLYRKVRQSILHIFSVCFFLNLFFLPWTPIPPTILACYCRSNGWIDCGCVYVCIHTQHGDGECAVATALVDSRRNIILYYISFLRIFSLSLFLLHSRVHSAHSHTPRICTKTIINRWTAKSSNRWKVFFSSSK